MSSYFPTSSEVDPISGLPKKKKQQQAVNQAWSGFGPQIASSLGQNPKSTFGPSPQVDYGFGTATLPRLPGMPNYAGLIDSDPLYQQTKLDFTAQGVSDAAQRAALTQRALVQYGLAPDFSQTPGLNAQYLNEDVTPQTRQLAQTNTEAGLSITARQQKAFQDQLRAIKNHLAARGALRSGETGHALQNAQLGYDQARFDTTNELADFIAGLQAGYAERQRLMRLQQAQAAVEAEGRVRTQYPYQAPAGSDVRTPYGYADYTPPGNNTGDAGDELLSPWRNDWVDNTVTRNQQQLAEALRRHRAA